MLLDVLISVASQLREKPYRCILTAKSGDAAIGSDAWFFHKSIHIRSG